MSADEDVPRTGPAPRRRQGRDASALQRAAHGTRERAVGERTLAIEGLPASPDSRRSRPALPQSPGSEPAPAPRPEPRPDTAGANGHRREPPPSELPARRSTTRPRRAVRFKRSTVEAMNERLGRGESFTTLLLSSLERQAEALVREGPPAPQRHSLGGRGSRAVFDATVEFRLFDDEYAPFERLASQVQAPHMSYVLRRLVELELGLASSDAELAR